MSVQREVNTCADNNSKVAMRMSDDYQIYHKSNGITRKDAQLCLQEYSPKFNWWKNKPRILDVGSGDGSVTEILSRYLPANYEVLIGADISPISIKFATEKYGTNKIKFRQVDIEGEIPDDMKNSFDHVFSFYTFHWVDDHEKAFTNIYNMLEENGEFFSIFLAYADVYFVFEILSKTTKWGAWIKDFHKFPSPYYDFEDPDVHITKMLQKIGFKVLDVRCKQRLYYYKNIEVMKGIVTAINSFDIPKNMWEEFLDDYIETQRSMKLIDETEGTVKAHYNLLVVHCAK